jgi:hypothetical protein
MSDRNDVDALAARHAELAAEVERKQRERDAAASLLDEARTHAKLPLLDNIRLATPCGVKWAEMIGDDRRRMCGQCDKQVYNLSGMTRDEAQALLIEKEGKLCARFFQRDDGTILLADCTVGKQQKRKRLVIAAGATAMLAGGGTLAYELTHTHAVAHVARRETAVAPPPVVMMKQSLRVDPQTVPPVSYTEVAGGISAEPLLPPPPVTKQPALKKAPHR